MEDTVINKAHWQLSHMNIKYDREQFETQMKSAGEVVLPYRGLNICIYDSGESCIYDNKHLHFHNLANISFDKWYLDVDFLIEEFYNEHRCSYINLIHYLDDNSKEGKMCVSNMECEQIKDAWKIGDWKTIINYINKYI